MRLLIGLLVFYGGVVGIIDTAFVIAGVHYNITVHTTPRACATPTDQDLFLTAPISQGKKRSKLSDFY